MTKKLKKQLTELIIFAGIVLWCVFNYNLFFDFIKFVLKLAMPIIVGIAIAFIINVPMKQIERKIFNIDKRKHKKFIRLISLILSIVLIFGILGLILFLIIPEVIEAVGQISSNLPSNFNWVDDLINKVNNLNKEGFLGDANILIDDCLVIEGIELREGRNGRYIMMPWIAKSKRIRRNAAYPITEDARRHILEEISNKYDEEN